MNDGIYHPQSKERMQAFKDGINKLIKKSQDSGARVILMTPPPYVANPKRVAPIDAPDFSYRRPYEKYDDVLKDYSNWILSLSPGIITVDTRKSLEELTTRMKLSNPKFSHTNDGIHPNPIGHLAMAEALIRALHGPKKVIVSPDNLSAFTTSSTYANIDKRRKLISNAYREHVGHKRPGKNKKIPLDQAITQANELDKLIRKATTISP